MILITMGNIDSTIAIIAIFISYGIGILVGKALERQAQKESIG